MCDFISWGVMKLSFPTLGLKKDQLIWLTDDMVIAKFGEDANFEDYVGHSGLARYYNIAQVDFFHKESRFIIPVKIAKDVNAGRMKRLAEAYGHNACSWRFTEPSDDPDMRMRKLDPRTIMFGTVPVPIVNMDVRAQIVQVLDAVRASSDFPANLSEAADLVRQKLLDPGYDINYWERTEFILARFVDQMFIWDDLEDKIPRENFLDLNTHVQKVWQSTATAVHNL